MIRSANIQDEWHWMESHVERMIERTREPFTAGDVYDEVAAGNARLFVADDGFVIWKVRICPHTQECTLWIWITWGNGPDMIGRYEQDLVKLGEMIGASRVAFRSPRKGYARVLGDQWKPAHIEYERRI